mgnify:CR=1 FL=1
MAMGTYRSPAVALMPDVTPKPLRSKGNAIINLMGAVGGVLYLLVAAALYSGKSAVAAVLPKTAQATPAAATTAATEATSAATVVAKADSAKP